MYPILCNCLNALYFVCCGRSCMYSSVDWVYVCTAVITAALALSYRDIENVKRLSNLNSLETAENNPCVG
jgi:hypothetical protein